MAAPESDSDRSERRIWETAQLLGNCATLDRTLPTLVIERAPGGTDARQRESLTLRELLGEGGMGAGRA